MSGDSKVKDPEYLRRRRRNDNAAVAVSDSADAVQPHADTRSEMEDLQHNLGNQAVTQLVRSGVVQRQKTPAAKPMDEAQARAELTTHWGVSRIDAGTAAEQEQQMLTLHTAYFPNMTPPANLGTLLTNAGWAPWKQQPYSRYSVEGGPSEDLPESVAAYVRDPATLKARSPARYDFVAALAAKVMGMGASGPLRART